MMAPELMGHVAIPYNEKEFVFHRGCSFNIKSILVTGLIAGGRESKEGRQTIFFTPLNPCGKNQMKRNPVTIYQYREKCIITTIGKTTRMLFWVKLSRAQDQGLQFWETKSNLLLVHDPVPAVASTE